MGAAVFRCYEDDDRHEARGAVADDGPERHDWIESRGAPASLRARARGAVSRGAEGRCRIMLRR